MIPSASKRTLSSILTSPSRVAQALDWKKSSGTVLSVAVQSDRLSLAVASHPGTDDNVTTLASVPLHTTNLESSHASRRSLSPKVATELIKIVQDFNVCGLIVSWPVQKEGWVGAPCGKVLNTLDQLVTQSKTLLTKSRPLCLWDEAHHQPLEDEWGRASIYAHTSHKTEHVASTEQYQAPLTLAANVWNDFCRAHWPELYYQSHSDEAAVLSSLQRSSTSTVVDPSWLDHYEETAAYTHATL
ncbi:hypothetical protein MPSEU_000176500 [Mayamaea pseudoterrestris]|nr:hypothetical protein MPSEU_000176500 [Mayamaea pseudoterrestris]